jgi:hypothetical protein
MHKAIPVKINFFEFYGKLALTPMHSRACIYAVLRFMHLRVLVFLGFLHDFRRVLFAPPPGLDEALGEPFVPRSTFFL